MSKEQPQSTHGKEEHRQYGAYQNEIYRAGMLHGILPRVTTDPNKLEGQAQSVLKPTSYNYVAGGAGERATMDANRLAFRQWKLVPRMLRPTTQRDVTVKLFGKKYESPVLMAPVGVQSIFHEDAETGMAEICAELGVPYILSTASSHSIEEVAAASGSGPRWFQLYWPQDDDITVSLLNRAKKNNYQVLVVTLDTWALAWRPADLDGGYIPFMTGTGVKTGFTDPVFNAKYEKKHGKKVGEDIIESSEEWIGDIFSGAAHTWEQIAFLKKHWDGPIVLKGIQHPEDAKLAIEHGVQGIIVSNHGGRQLDGAIGSLTALESITSELTSSEKERLTILFDSGIRGGVDIIKALCLGAKAVLIGRPAIYGLAIGGKKGAKNVLQGILADLDQSMGLAGIVDISQMGKYWLRKIHYAGEMRSSN